MKIVINSTAIEVPHQELRFRKRSEAAYRMMKEHGESTITSIIASNRISEISQQAYQDLVKPSLKNMPFWKLKDIDVAAKRISEAYINNEVIGLVTDFDVDGISSAVVMKKALVSYMGFKGENVQIHVNNRMLYGYGFNEKALRAVFDRAGDRCPTLLITADQGSNDTKTIRQFKEIMAARGFQNAAVIVSDHHHVKEGERCQDAHAFINPQRPDDEFDDPTICGCVVALLLMSAVREYMIKAQILPETTPKLTKLLTFASLATVADCVSLKSGYNRCIIRRGLKEINDGEIPAWRVLKAKLKKAGEQVNVEDMAFRLGPAINADSRTGGDGMDAVSFLLAENDEDAEFYYERLNGRNTRRKEIDMSMQESALAEASHQYYKLGRRGLVIYLPKGSHGIQGIVASRVKERFHCPVIIFSPVDVKEKDHPEKLLTGSGRCIDPFSIVGMVQDHVEKEVPIPTSGGHPAAMGMKIRYGDLSKFQESFDRVVKAQSVELNFPLQEFTPRVEIDHLFQENELSLLDDVGILSHINRLEPYGQRFEAPVFAINGKLTRTKAFGTGVNEGAHLNVFFRDSSGRERKGVVFHYNRQPWIDLLAVGDTYTFAVTLSYDAFANNVGLMVVAVSSGMNAVEKHR